MFKLEPKELANVDALAIAELIPDLRVEVKFEQWVIIACRFTPSDLPPHPPLQQPPILLLRPLFAYLMHKTQKPPVGMLSTRRFFRWLTTFS
jgi:hypothetical protein